MRPRLAVATTFPVHPRLGGGQVRVYNLYRRLARWFDVEIVSLTGADEPPRRVQLAPGTWETSIPKSRAHEKKEREIERECGAVVTDIAMADLYRLTPKYLTALRAGGEDARRIVACHPYVVDAIREVSDAALWYEAQDVEIALKTELLGDAPAAGELLTTVERVEGECCAAAESIWACSEEDREELARHYGATPDRVLVVPNGADLEETRYVDPDDRRHLQEPLRLGGRLQTVFVASWHHPNIVGAEDLISAARAMPRIDFHILGSVGLAFTDRTLPANVHIAGPVTAPFKQDLLSIADFALNPVTSGSGTNLKMLEYFGSGVPVISSQFGARGLGVRAGDHYTCAEPAQLPSVLHRLRAGDRSEPARRARAARAFIEEHLSWEVIVDRLAGALGLGTRAGRGPDNH